MASGSASLSVQLWYSSALDRRFLRAVVLELDTPFSINNQYTMSIFCRLVSVGFCVCEKKRAIVSRGN